MWLGARRHYPPMRLSETDCDVKGPWGQQLILFTWEVFSSVLLYLSSSPVIKVTTCDKNIMVSPSNYGFCKYSDVKLLFTVVLKHRKYLKHKNDVLPSDSFESGYHKQCSQ